MSFNLKINSITKNSFFWTIIVFHALAFFYKIIYGDFFTIVDSEEYYKLAYNIINHFEFYSGNLEDAVVTEHYTKRPPLYALFIVIASLGLKSKVILLLIQNVVSIATILLTFKLFKSYYTLPKKPLLIVFIGLSLSQYIYANLIMSETLLAFLIVVTVYVVHKALTTKERKFLVYLQIAIILLFLLKPVFYLFVIPNIVIVYFIAKRMSFKPGVFLAFVPILALLFFMHWNYVRTGSHNFSGIQQINMVDYNLKYFLVNTKGPEHAETIVNEIDTQSTAIKNYPDRITFINTSFINYIKEDVFGYALFHLKGSIRFFIDPGRFDAAYFLGLNASSELGLLKHFNENGVKGVIEGLNKQHLAIVIYFILMLVLNGLKLIGFAYYLFKCLKNQLVFIIVLFFIGYIAFMTGPLGMSRFMVPVLSLYSFMACIGFYNLLLAFNPANRPKHL